MMIITATNMMMPIVFLYSMVADTEEEHSSSFFVLVISCVLFSAQPTN